MTCGFQLSLKSLIVSCITTRAGTLSCVRYITLKLQCSVSVRNAAWSRFGALALATSPLALVYFVWFQYSRLELLSKLIGTCFCCFNLDAARVWSPRYVLPHAQASIRSDSESGESYGMKDAGILCIRAPDISPSENSLRYESCCLSFYVFGLYSCIVACVVQLE